MPEQKLISGLKLPQPQLLLATNTVMDPQRLVTLQLLQRIRYTHFVQHNWLRLMQQLMSWQLPFTRSLISRLIYQKMHHNAREHLLL